MPTPQEKKHHKIPDHISEYIKKNFREGFLTDIQEVKSKKGEISYKVDVGEDENIYHLHFSKDGKLLSREMEPIYPVDRHEGFFHEEGYSEKDV